jgi:heme exporter protein B
MGIMLYVASTVYTIYLSIQSIITPAVWSAIFWIVLLFIATVALSRTFLQEERRQLYYFFNISSSLVILSKMIYSVIFMWVTGLFGWLIYAVLLGVPSFTFGLYLLNFVNGVTGIAVALTMISSLAVRTRQTGNMMAVLGFPVILPILLLAITNSRKIVEGGQWQDISEYSLILCAVNVIIIALTLILFPYSWKS